MADVFAQALVNSPVWVQLMWLGIMLAFLIWMATPLLWTWLLFRFFRDVHAIRNALEHQAYESERLPAPARHDRAAAPAAVGSISSSAFGR